MATNIGSKRRSKKREGGRGEGKRESE